MHRYALVALLAACSSSSQPAAVDAPGAPPIDATPVVVADAPPPPSDAPTVAAAAACPTSGSGAISDAAATCVTFTAAQTGADAAGVNATSAEYALAPTAAGTGRLVVFLNPSLGSPAQSIATPTTNLYTAAIAAGDHVIALAYRSDDIIGALCANNDGCYLPTRLTIVTGVAQAGASASVANILPTEGIHARLALALSYLAAAQPGGGWAQYLTPGADPVADPADAVAWTKVYAMGHSQGGGHAALLAKLHPIARLVTLSSPCDAIGNTPASWQTPDGTWKSSPAAIGYGLAIATVFTGGNPTGGDTTCPAHGAIWTALGMVASHEHDNALPCAGASDHTATTQCTANMPAVQALLTP